MDTPEVSIERVAEALADMPLHPTRGRLTLVAAINRGDIRWDGEEWVEHDGSERPPVRSYSVHELEQHRWVYTITSDDGRRLELTDLGRRMLLAPGGAS